jgi:hypothetical protein
MFPLVGVPPSIAQFFSQYRDLFCRQEGFAHVSRYLTGLLLSENKTLQGIYANQVWPEEETVSRRAMHEAVFEAGWNNEGLMPKHRTVVASDHRGRGKEVIGIDWTLTHHDRSQEIFGVKRGYDYVENRMSSYQTVMTAVIANEQLIDGIEVVVQTPNYEKEEKAYLEMTVKQSYEQMEQVQERLLELMHYQKNRLAYRKRTEIAVDMVREIELEGNFPEAHYAFDNGVLSRPLTELIEQCNKHWVSEIECSRHINWGGKWQRVDGVAHQLRTSHPESFRTVRVKCRNGKEKKFWAFTKTVRLKKYGRKRLVIVHEQEDLSDQPRFLLTDALHWESGRVIKTWNYRWPTEVFHEFTKQITGLESSQVRNEEAVKRHFRLSCVAQSLLQRVACAGRKSEKFNFAEEKQTVGQKLYSLTREALRQLVDLVQCLLNAGKSTPQIMEVLMTK